jgi:two-component system nitrate/nitrite response regulator NarL
MRLVLCDDHDMLLEALTTVFTRLGWEVQAVCRRADEVADLVVEHQPDVLVLDVMLGSASGLEAAAVTRERAPQVKLLLLTGCTTDQVWRAFERGTVDGLVSKGCGIDVLERSIRRVAGGQRVVEGWAEPALRPAGRTPSLTSRERQVLELLVQGATTRGIAESLGVSGNTVRTHVQNLFQKLGVHGRAKAVNLAVAAQLFDEPYAGLPEPALRES